MSSVKRRKISGDVPAGILKSKKTKAPGPKTAAPTSPEPEVVDEAPKDEEVTEEEAATKTFKDLVSHEFT